MGRIRALSIAAAFALLGTTAVQSADLLPPAPAVDMPLRGSIVETGGFYVRGDVGIGLNSNGRPNSVITGFTPANLAYSGGQDTPGAIVGVGAGYQFNSWFRADVTGEWHDGGRRHWYESYSDTPGANTSCVGNVNGPVSRCIDSYKVNFSHRVFLANGYLDLGTYGSITPYIGVGVGAAYNRISVSTDLNAALQNGGIVDSPASSKWNFAYAFMTGFSTDIAPNLKLDVGYRYLNMGKMTGAVCQCGGTVTETQNYKFASNDIRVGLRYIFADSYQQPAAQPDNPTLVRKY